MSLVEALTHFRSKRKETLQRLSDEQRAILGISVMNESQGAPWATVNALSKEADLNRGIKPGRRFNKELEKLVKIGAIDKAQGERTLQGQNFPVSSLSSEASLENEDYFRITEKGKELRNPASQAHR